MELDGKVRTLKPCPKMQVVERDKLWRQEGSAHDPKHKSLYVKLGVENVMAWVGIISETLSGNF